MNKTGKPEIGMGVYSIEDIAMIFRLPVRKVKRWIKDYWQGIMQKVHRNSYMWAEGKETMLNFYGLIEFYAFYQLREAGVSTQNILKSYQAIAAFKQVKYPFAAAEILTDGGSILFKYNDEVLIDADKGYKTRITHLLKTYCRNIDFDESRIAKRLYPLGRNKKIIIDTQHQFGQPVIEGTNIYPDTVFYLYKAGEQTDRLTKLFDLSTRQVEDAIAYCETAA